MDNISEQGNVLRLLYCLRTKGDVKQHNSIKPAIKNILFTIPIYKFPPIVCCFTYIPHGPRFGQPRSPLPPVA